MIEEAAEELDHRRAVHHDALRGQRHGQRQGEDEDRDDDERRKPWPAAQAVAQVQERRPGREAQDPGEEDRAHERLQHQEAADHQQRDRRDPGVLLETACCHGDLGNRDAGC